MLSSLPVARVTTVRRFFVGTVLVTLGFMIWVTVLRSGSSVSGLSPVFVRLFLFEDHDALIVTLLLLLVLMLLPSWAGLRHVPTWLAEHPWLVCALTIAVLSVGSVFVYKAQPLSMDEYAPVFQSQVFAHGHLTGHFPPALMDWLIPPGFQNIFFRVSPVTGNVISAYWPSFALLLTPFTWLGIPWACNAVLSGLTLVTLRKLALDLFGSKEAAGLAMLFTLASPVFFADGISFYSMTAHLLFNSLFALLLLNRTPQRLLLAGVVGSVALTLHNPLPHALFALPWILLVAVRRRGLHDLAILVVGYLPIGLPLLLGWYHFGSELVNNGVPEANVGQARLVASLMSWPTATIVFERFIGFAKVWIWAAPGLLLLAVAGARRWRDDPRCLTLVASAAITFVAYFFFTPDQGHGWGFRYFHSAWLVLPLLAAGALTPHAAQGQRSTAEGDSALVLFVVPACLLMLVIGVSLRAVQIEGYLREHLAQLPAYEGKESRVILIDPRSTVYGGDLVQNDPFLRNDAVLMLRLDAAAVPVAVHLLHPGYRRVYADRRGEIWSAGASD